MVRLTDLKTNIETWGQHNMGPGAIPDGMVRRVYKIKAQLRGATLGNLYLYGAMGATVGATIDQFKFGVADQIIEFPDGVIEENAAPIYQLDRATYDNLFASAETASCDLFIMYADEYP